MSRAVIHRAMKSGKQQRQQLIEERRSQRHQAEIDRLRAALEEAETQECMPLRGG